MGCAHWGPWFPLTANVFSPHRWLLGGSGREDRLPHIPKAEGQEDGRPSSSPLCLLQQDRTLCGESGGDAFSLCLEEEVASRVSEPQSLEKQSDGPVRGRGGALKAGPAL